jgi:lysophospholipid acyltransferase (LPLAT)-like uncharacterized protein
MRLPDAVNTVLLRAVANLLGVTWRYEIEGWHHVDPLLKSGSPVVAVVWHGRLLPVAFHHRAQGVGVLVSRHRDGGYLARVARGWGYRVVRGSTRRGGTAGLLGIVRLLEEGHHIAVTPDGPRGPAEEVQPGAVAAAQHTGAPIVPIGAAADRGWWVRSWDRFLVPKPFARVHLVYGEPVSVAGGEEGLSRGVADVQRALDAVTERA